MGFLDLPDDVLLHLYAYLSIQDVLALKQVSHNLVLTRLRTRGLDDGTRRHAVAYTLLEAWITSGTD
jgi:hypothetical protein